MLKDFIMLPTSNWYGTVLFLPGRDGSAEEMMCKFSALTKMGCALVGIEPVKEWYPMPNGPNDQELAVAGLRYVLQALNHRVEKLRKRLSVERDEIALVGFSAGAVVALELAANSKHPFAGVVACGGAILEPTRFPACKHDTPVLLIHNRDDNCFEWQERYIPMRKTLRKKGYPLNCIERRRGGHCMSNQDILLASVFLADTFQPGLYGYRFGRFPSVSFDTPHERLAPDSHDTSTGVRVLETPGLPDAAASCE